MKTNLQSVMRAIVLSVTFFCVAMSASSVGFMFCVDDIYYAVSDWQYGAYVVSNDQYGYHPTYSGDIIIRDSVYWIDDYIPVTGIAANAFIWCENLTSITFPPTLTYIGDRAFEGCTGLRSISIPNSVYDISNNAFFRCTNLTSLTIGNSVETIGDQAFCNCIHLTSVTLPSTITYIGDHGFGYWGEYESSSLDTVRCLAMNPPQIAHIFYDEVIMTDFVLEAFEDDQYHKIIVEVPAAAVEAYRNDEYWGKFVHIKALSTNFGDLDGDGKVNIADVTSLIDVLLSGNASGFNIDNADVNGDGRISIDDVTELINILLTGN